MVDGPFGSSLKASEYVMAGVPIIRLQNVHRRRFLEKDIKYISEAKAAQLARHSYRPGDIVIAKLGDCGASCIVPESAGSGIIVADIVRFRGDEKRIDHRYLVHFLNAEDALGQVGGMTKGSTRARVNLSDFRDVLVPILPLSEQRRIADILDRADAIRRKRKEAIALTEELLRSTFLEMFGDPVTNPKGWRVKPLGDLAEVNRGKFSPRPRNDPRYYGGAYPFIQTGDLSGTTGYLRQWKQTLNAEGCAVSRGFPRGTIAIAIAANIGDTAIVDYDFWCPDSVVGIEGRAVSPEYLEMHLRHQQAHLEAGAPETAQKNINLEVLRPLPIMVPSSHEQRAYSALYRATYALAAQYRKGVLLADDLFGSLVQRAFRGDLSSRGAKERLLVPMEAHG
jgi:type I restriction enzyme S subunit